MSSISFQSALFAEESIGLAEPPRGQLLKWIGNKHRLATQIVALFPEDMRAYWEPFLGSGAVLATVSPDMGFASDAFPPLIEIWQELKSRPEELKRWYRDRWELFQSGDRVERYEEIKKSFNESPNGADLLFLCRSCYGGVVRFRKIDGYMSTPCGIHSPISPDRFATRVDEWRRRVAKTEFSLAHFADAMRQAKAGDVVYCDPPYSHTQAILYGAQSFSFESLLAEIEVCKARGVRVLLSIDGTKKSGAHNCELPIPEGLFEREVFLSIGRSMLRRFQLAGQTLEAEEVSERLLLSY